MKNAYKNSIRKYTMITVDKELKQEETFYKKNKSGNMGDYFDRYWHGVGVECFWPHRHRSVF